MRSHNAKTARPRRFSYHRLDKIIHERARLSILASLLAHPSGLAFGEMLELCDLTDGNLSRHLQVLQAERLVTLNREIGPGRPQTTCRLTALGRRRLLEYLAALEQVLQDAAAALDAGASAGARPATARG